MPHRQTTSWNLIHAAAQGGSEEREEFARRYTPILRTYFLARWSEVRHRAEIEDAIQECFLDCFREGGALERAEPGGPGGFRAYLRGVAHHIAQRCERRWNQEREQVAPEDLPESPGSERGLSQAFDRVWARTIMREAVACLEERSQGSDPRAARRLELLRLRFQEDLAIREIAERWGVDAAELHHDYARARKEFKTVLLEVVARYHSGTPGEIERECIALLGLLE